MESYFQFSVDEHVRAYPPNTHYHQDYEVYYLIGGRCRYFIGSKTYPMNPGDIVLIPPGVIHKVLYDTPSHSRQLINCTADYIPVTARKYLDANAYYPAARQAAAFFSQLRETQAEQDSFYDDTLRFLAMGLFLQLARSAALTPPTPGGSFVEDAVGYIQSHFADPVTLTQTAKHCAVSPEHLSRMFKKETGFRFSEYLTLYRMKKAETMLRTESGMSVSQVALACGFQDSNYFSASYKKMYGISPSQIKKQSLQEEYNV